MLISLLSLIAFAGIALSGYLLFNEYRAKGVLQKREQDIRRRIFELAILKEIGDRVGYSLDVQQIVDIITGSLHQFIEYAAVSYLLLEPEKVVFKMHLERSVHRSFVNDVRDRMLGSLGALLDHELKKDSVSELLSGAMLLEDVEEPVRSFFTIPLVIGEQTVGILAIADTKADLYKDEETAILEKLVQQASHAVTRLHEVVRTEQEKVAAMVESMEDGVVMTDQDYRILVINPAAKRVIGVENKKDVTIFDFIDNLGGKIDIRGRLEEAVKLRKPFGSERFLSRDKFFQAFVFPVETSRTIKGTKVLGGVVIFHDITREVELERVREDFTSMIVHELRTPLSNIEKISELLRSASAVSDNEKTQYIDMIHQSSASMLELVNDILDVAKIQAGKFEVLIRPANLMDILSNRVKFFELSAAAKKIALKVVMSPNLPKEALFDPERIREVCDNLISNALKYTPERGAITIGAFLHKLEQPITEAVVELGVHLPAPLPQELQSLPSSIIVFIADTGGGIKKNDQQQIFNKFKQLPNQDYSGIKGTGLGLAIVKGIMESHRGQVGVVSEFGVGSAFYFVLPLIESKETAAA